VGRKFEEVARNFFLSKENIKLVPNFSVPVGVSDRKNSTDSILGALHRLY
jgi:hypothetical protein